MSVQNDMTNNGKYLDTNVEMSDLRAKFSCALEQVQKLKDDIIIYVDKYTSEGLIIEDKIVTGYSGDEEDIIIPSEVIGINDMVFMQNSMIKSVLLPNSISFIGDAAFCGCINLETINFPNGLMYIGDDAFLLCERIQQIELPQSLLKLGTNAFGRCESLEMINIPSRLTLISSDTFHGCSSMKSIKVDDEEKLMANGMCLLDGCIYDETYEHLLAAPGSKEKFDFPDGIKTIGNAIAGNKGIKELILPDSINIINDEAFSNCSNLVSITLGRGMRSIGRLAFSDCKKLETIYIKSKKEDISIDKDAFLHCKANVNFLGQV